MPALVVRESLSLLHVSDLLDDVTIAAAPASLQVSMPSVLWELHEVTVEISYRHTSVGICCYQLSSACS